MNHNPFNVQVGAVYRDCDKRMNGRHIKVIEVGTHRAVCHTCDATGRIISTRPVRIRLDRFRPTSTGFAGPVLVMIPERQAKPAGREPDSSTA